MNQKWGRRTQDEFKLLCSSAEITRNPSFEDDYGWDFLVGIPMTAAEGVLTDKWPPPRSAFLQVKSTKCARPRLDLKMSNALRLAKNPAPCFMVLFHELKEGQQKYARLFGKKDTERARKRARRLSVEGKTIHKTIISFAFSEQEEHTTDLLDWMANCVQGLAPDYGEANSRLTDRIGYEDRNYQASFIIVG